MGLQGFWKLGKEPFFMAKTCSIYKQVIWAFCLTGHSCLHELILKDWILRLGTSRNCTILCQLPRCLGANRSAGISWNRKSKTFIGSQLEASDFKTLYGFPVFPGLPGLAFLAVCDLQFACFSCWDFGETTVQALRYGRILWCFSTDRHQHLTGITSIG